VKAKYLVSNESNDEQQSLTINQISVNAVQRNNVWILSHIKIIIAMSSLKIHTTKGQENNAWFFYNP